MLLTGARGQIFYGRSIPFTHVTYSISDSASFGLSATESSYVEYIAADSATLGLSATETSYRAVYASDAASLGLSATVSQTVKYVVIDSASLVFSAFGAWSTDAGGPSVDSRNNTWAINLDTGASTRFDNFGFNSFATTATAVLACATNGIYAMGGATDAGKAITASIKTPRAKFGTAYRTRVTDLYVTGSSDAYLNVTVDADGMEYTYRYPTKSTNVLTHRVKIGKGLTSNLWGFTLASARPFVIEAVQPLPEALTRRIG